VHATGHAQADDIKTLLSVARPEWYVPIHGEYRHLVANSRLGKVMGVAQNRILVCEDGDVLTISDDGVEISGRVPAGYLYVDGILGDVGHGVLRDRRLLAEEGVVVVIVAVDRSAGEVLTEPELVTRGWVHRDEAEELLDEGSARVADAVRAAFANGIKDVEGLEREVRRAAGRFVSERTRRRPMIVPVVMEV
jgi:ribonuclease J